MDTNGLHIVTYKCTHFTTDGDKLEFIKGLYKDSKFLILQELWLYESEFHNIFSSISQVFFSVLLFPILSVFFLE